MLLKGLGETGALCILHPEEAGLALVDVIPYCSPVLVAKTGSPHPCL